MKPFPKSYPSFAIDPLGAGGMLQPVAEPRIDDHPRLDDERGSPPRYPEKPAERQQFSRPPQKLGCRGPRATPAGYCARSCPTRIGAEKSVVLVRYVLPLVGIS